MTLDEAIVEEKYKAKRNREFAKIDKAFPCSYATELKCKYEKRAEEHEQLAELLEELKSYRAHIFSGDMTQAMLKEQYCKAIDDFLEKIQWEYLNGCGIEQKEIEFLIAVSSQVAEQLKAGGE